MRLEKHRSVAGLMSAVVLAAGCIASSASFAQAPSATPSAVGNATPTAAPSLAATPSPVATPTAQPAASRTPGAGLAGKTAVTVVDGVRVRSQPRVSDDSFKYDPVLPLGTPLYVLDGPVSASDYDWYDVVALTSRPDLHSGWVASASRDGEPWVTARAFACPPKPTDLRSLRALPSSVGLACFPRMPITVQARLVDGNGEMDGPTYSPAWFGLGSGGKLLVEPDVTRPPADPRNWFMLELDPAGQHPAVLPVGKVVEVTGIFDHPAAAACTGNVGVDDTPIPTQDCRLQFAVTRLITVQS